MICPKCHENTLDPFGMIEGVHVDFCSGCKGIWFDEGELAFYTEMPVDIPNIAQSISAGSKTEWICPKCPNTALVEVHYLEKEHPLLDFCPNCKGVFVDKGELPMIEKLTVHCRGAEVLGHVTKELEKRGYQVLGMERRESKVPK